MPLGSLSKPQEFTDISDYFWSACSARPWGAGRNEGASQPAGPRIWVEEGGQRWMVGGIAHVY